MNFPNFTFWSHLLGTVGVEICCVAALGFLAQLMFRRPVWQRTIWQIAVICLLLLPASEWTGFSRGMTGFLVSKKQVAQIVPASGFVIANAEIARRLANRSLDWQPLAAARPAAWWPGWVWLAGTAIILARMVAAQVLLLALRLRREKIANESLRERVVYVARSVGLRRKTSLLRMPEAISPMAFGILRPSVGLPPGFETRFSAAEQEAVLAHELAHLAALDPMWFGLADFASAMLWWHPLAWWVRRSLNVSSEMAADEAAAAVPDGPGSLAKCLVVLGKEMTAGRGWGWVGINGGFRSKLGRRVERLMQMSVGANRPLAGRVGSAIRITVAILVVPTVVLLSGAFQYAKGQNADGWRSEMRRSWNNSPAALLLLAALDDTGNHTKDIATRVQDAKLYYEMGKLDEAEAILVQVLKDDPSNRTALYYLDMIKEARFMDRTRKRAISPIPLANLPNPLADTNLVHTTVGRQEILSKLDHIILDQVQYDLPLAEVLRKLTIESRKRDPDGVGVNFFIRQFPDANVGAPPGAVAAMAPAPPVDLSMVTIKISPRLQNLRLADVLNAIVMAADQPIRYRVEDDGVVFSLKSYEPVMLYYKVFQVDPDTFVQGLTKAGASDLSSGSSAGTNSTIQSDAVVRAYFTAAGVNLTDPDKSVFYNERLCLLVVRATAQDLEIIQKALEATHPPQVTVEAKFVEMSQQDGTALGFNWFLQGSTTNVTGIMSDPQFRAAINAIEHKTGSDILTAPRVTTLSGRQAHVSSLDGDQGATLDVIPKVEPDGYSIQTTVVAGFKRGNQAWRVSATNQEIRDGQTLVLGGMTTNQPPDATRLRLVFITPTIIDPAGNRVHSDAELSGRH